jgi:hypothetical protein
MPRLTIAVAFALCASWAQAQGVSTPPTSAAPPDFSGEWVLVSGIPDGPLFREGRIEQNAKTLTFQVSNTPGGLFDEPRVLFLDGSESFYTHKNVRGDEAWLLASRLRRVNGTLEIATVTTRAAAERASRFESLWTLSLNAEGQLVVVRSEPTVQGSTATLKTIYRRK